VKKETLIPELDTHDFQGGASRAAFSVRLPGLWGVSCGRSTRKAFLRFRCRVGHALTAKSLRSEQRHAVETALWEALRALEESASLYRKMAGRARGASHELPAQL
jgi:hypothetical protein